MSNTPTYIRFLRRLVVGTALATASFTSGCADEASCSGDACDPAPDTLADTTPDTTEQPPDTGPNWGEEVPVQDGPLPPPDLPASLV